MPVGVKNVFGQMGVKDKSRALGLRLNKKLYLCIVAKGLEVTDSDDLSGRLFFI